MQVTTYWPVEEETSNQFITDNSDLDRMEYEQRCYDVQCKICGVMQRASQMFLENQKWALTRKGEFCPSH